MKRSSVGLVLAVAMGSPMIGCDPVAGDDGVGGAVTNPIGGCEVDGRDVLLVVETSRRMSLGSGYSQGSKEISRYEMVKDTLKHSLPKLKKAIDFGLILFPFEGEKDKKGAPRVCPTSCAVGDTLIQPGSPYGWMVSSLEHAAEGGRAAVGGALAGARAYFEGRPAAGRVRSVMLFAA
ncbi:MAG: hypothetical protein FJ087_21375, partial [Deltaproteobacteria bacterium]|nr:hypothetical protein [Deltaproteobacteria bacterium]